MWQLLLAVDLALQARTMSPGRVVQATGHIVSLRPYLDPMALLFTRHLNILIQKVVDLFGWDWREVLEGIESVERKGS
jgi:hypothetical protein